MISKLVGTTLVGAAFAFTAFALTIDSGLKVGEGVTPFHPKHVTGALKGTKSCPPCTYGARPQVQVWVNGDDHENISAITKLLNDSMKQNQKAELKAFVVIMLDSAPAADFEAKITKYAEKSGFDNVSITYLTKDNEAVANYKVNTSPDVKNTVFVYKDKIVASKFVNLKADEKGLAALSASIKGIVK